MSGNFCLTEITASDGLVLFLFFCSLFPVAHLADLDRCGYAKGPPEWYGYLPFPLVGLYARIGRLVTGKSPGRFSLLCSAQINTGLLALAWYMLALPVVALTYGAKFAQLPLSPPLLPVAVFVAAALSVLALMWEGGAARTITCALCLSASGPEKGADAAESPEECFRHGNPHCLCPGERRSALCRPGHLLWPGTSLEVAAQRKPDSRPISIAIERIRQNDESARCSEKCQVPPEAGTGYFGCDESGQRHEGRGSNAAQRNKDFPEQRRLESAGSFRITGHRPHA